MSKTTTATTPATVEVAVPSQVEILATLLADLAVESKGNDPKTFSSGNTGLYVNSNLKAPDARALGLVVPVGGKVKLTLQAVVIDPANSKDA